MMRVPEHELLMHWAGELYDPVKAHAYYEKHKHLKGREKGTKFDPSSNPATRGLTKKPSAKAAQRKELQDRIQRLSQKLVKLEELIRKKESEAASEDRKSKAKKERAAKEKDKPKTAAEKAKAARDNKKYADKHKTELKNKAKAKDSKSGGGSSKSGSDSKSSGPSVSELRSLATRVKGQIAVAKQKLAAL